MSKIKKASQFHRTIWRGSGAPGAFFILDQKLMARTHPVNKNGTCTSTFGTLMNSQNGEPTKKCSVPGLGLLFSIS